MATKKKDLEIIYNLQWKNNPANGGDRANIIGMYDIPATTLNWEIFKSYLLKNSGTIGDDVKVSYITDSNREFPIESQTDFQIALYAFRRKARLGEFVNLKLDITSEQPTHKNLRHSNDVETQIDNNEAVSLTSTCCNLETAPEWFITYMSQFKKNITEELTATVSGIVSNIKPHVVSQPSCYHSRKSKPECPKRVRKLAPLMCESSHETKDLLKSLKLEGKLERKLEKLEHKTKKIKEKKLSLLTKSSDSDAGHSSSRSQSLRYCEKKDDLLEMDAAPVNAQSVVPHMLGGEVYLHQWQVMNTGRLPWTSKTTLNFTWGSKALKPLDAVISVPYLKPGEIGNLAVRLQIPDHPGQYECYWHFHHKERRFGHWLGCQIIVDPFDLKGNKSVLETSFVSEFISNPKKFKNTDGEYQRIDDAVTQYSEIFDEPAATPHKYTFNIDHNIKTEEPKQTETKKDPETVPEPSVLDSFVRDISSKVDDMKLHDPTDTNCSSDSDNQSIVSLSESNSSKSIPDEFVVVPIPDCFKIDQEPTAENVPERQVNADKDLVTDSAGPSTVRQASQESVRMPAEASLVNFDDNNNSEKTNQNSPRTESPVKLDDSLSNDGSQKSDVVVISIPNKEEEDTAGYAYLIVDGHRLPIPKKILNSEYLKIADEAASSPKENLTRTNSVASSVETGAKKEEQSKPEPATTPNVQQSGPFSGSVGQRPESEANSDLWSQLSIAASCGSEAGARSCVSEVPEQDKNSRLFIFPQACPGFEVVYPVLDGPEKEYKWSESDTQYAFARQPTPPASAPPLSPTVRNKNPFTAGATVHVPNYQQTPPEQRSAPAPPTAFANAAEAANVPKAQAATGSAGGSGAATPENGRSHENTPPIHILPETLVTGAVNAASTAMNTVRSVFNMVVPREQPGRWVNGHWVSTNPETPREANLHALAEMGFWNRDLNATLLARYNDDLSRVVAELVQ